MIVVAKPETARPWNHEIKASAPTKKTEPQRKKPEDRDDLERRAGEGHDSRSSRELKSFQSDHFP